jgi:hypothetical protein
MYDQETTSEHETTRRHKTRSRWWMAAGTRFGWFAALAAAFACSSSAERPEDRSANGLGKNEPTYPAPGKADNGSKGVPCGPNTCDKGESCCNESCGICTSPGGACPQIYCEPPPPPQCKVAEDCPQPAGPCQLCPDGSTACPSADCVDGQCVGSFDGCPPDNGDPVQCKAADDCPAPALPCELCPDGSTACPWTDCIGGQCVGGFDSCQPGKTECSSDADCHLEDNYCGGCNCLALPKGESGPICKDPVQCFAQPCGFGQVAACVSGQCVVQ